MKIKINGKEKEFTESSNLKDVISSYCKSPELVVAELNENIIKSSSWENTILKNGDSVELVSFVGGG